MEWTTGIEVMVIVAVVACLSFLAILFVRRRWLSSRGGVFDCAVKLKGSPTGWALGMARYHREELQWYRIFSLSFRPRLVLRRRDTSWVGQRAPEPEESMMLFTDHQVAVLRGRDRRGRERRYELAMTPGSVTGLMSWLEAAPPGVDYEALD